MTPDRRDDRQAATRAALALEGLDALLVTHLPNVRYLTGFTGTAALLLVTADRTVLVSDFRYEAQASQEVGNSATIEIDRSSVWDRLGRVIGAAGIGTLGVEAHVMTLRDAERLSALPRLRVAATTDIVERLRASKGPEEVAAIRAAAELAQDALDELLPSVRVGQSEQEISASGRCAERPRTSTGGRPMSGP